MKALRTVFAVTLAIAAGSALAQSGAEVVKSKGCLNCHAVDTKKVGPSFKDIAAKFQGKSAALVEQLKTAKGHPKVNASEAEIKAAVDYVLSQK
ncbi:MAG TPA: c-type cytochrome [Burkholderiales bacterium]|nr:c-type cytochrome [Burkholderiales bacterium]